MKIISQDICTVFRKQINPTIVLSCFLPNVESDTVESTFRLYLRESKIKI